VSPVAQVLVCSGGIRHKITLCFPGFLSDAMLFLLPWFFSLQKGFSTL